MFPCKVLGRRLVVGGESIRRSDLSKCGHLGG